MRAALLSILSCLLVPAAALADPPATCPTDELDATRWLASRPRVPMAISTGDLVATAGQPCCSPWATLGQTWHALDAWGQLAGTAEVTSAERYDVTRCEELTLEMTTGGAGVELFVSPADWTPRPSAERSPTEDEERKLLTFLDARDRALRADVLIPTPTSPDPKPLDPDQRIFDTDDVRHFQWTDDQDVVHRCAAVGGGALIVACLDDRDQWQARFTDAEVLPTVRDGGGIRILSIVHVDGDAVPEVVIDKNWSDTWQNDIVGYDPKQATWITRAESIHGAYT